MSEDQIIAQRKEKLARLRASGVEPYPARVQRTHTTQEAVDLLGDSSDPNAVVTVTGRVTATRHMGKATFLDLRDGSGRIQVYVKQESVGIKAYDRLLHQIDLGDFLGVTGTLFQTKTGEPTVEARGFTLLAKALRPPPEKWHGLQ